MSQGAQHSANALAVACASHGLPTRANTSHKSQVTGCSALATIHRLQRAGTQSNTTHCHWWKLGTSTVTCLAGIYPPLHVEEYVCIIMNLLLTSLLPCFLSCRYSAIPVLPRVDCNGLQQTQSDARAGAVTSG
eukprot:3902773-Rhodomonas_salina.1